MVCVWDYKVKKNGVAGHLKEPRKAVQARAAPGKRRAKNFGDGANREKTSETKKTITTTEGTESRKQGKKERKTAN